MKKRMLSLLLILTVLCTACFGMTGSAFAYDQGNKVNVQLSVDGKEPVTVKAYYASYTHNTYVSLEDLAWALKGTAKAFDLDLTAGNVVTTGTDYTGAEPAPFTSVSIDDPSVWDKISFDAYTITIDGKEYELRMYDNYKYSLFDGDVKGLYVRLIDLGMFMNLSITSSGYGQMAINTNEDFTLDLDALEAGEYFHDLDGVYLGDITTGTELYAWDENHTTEIASTSKLMTTAVVLDAVAAGEISLDSIYTISDAVHYEALSEDGTLYSDIPSSGKVEMKVGQTWSISDLLAALLLPSANEAGTALAEAVAGSEEAFVVMMNDKAAELGMTTAEFYNPHGLPDYANSQYTGKRQNHMSAKDMYTLASYLLTTYKDEVVAITGQQRIYLNSLADDVYKAAEGENEAILYGDEENGYIPYVKTTYSTLFKNIDGLIGLKTGTTNRSGACIVTAIDAVDQDGETHTIVSVSLGGEDNRERYETSTVLLKYAQQWVAEYMPFYAPVAPAPSTPVVPSTPAGDDATQPGEDSEVVAPAAVKIVAHTKLTKVDGKKAVKVYWNGKDGAELNYDGYEVFRSVKKNSGYGKKPIFETKKEAYWNTAIKAGNTYYYKVRGYKVVDGEKVYSDWSTKAWRTVK